MAASSYHCQCSSLYNAAVVCQFFSSPHGTDWADGRRGDTTTCPNYAATPDTTYHCPPRPPATHRQLRALLLRMVRLPVLAPRIPAPATALHTYSYHRYSTTAPTLPARYTTHSHLFISSVVLTSLPHGSYRLFDALPARILPGISPPHPLLIFSWFARDGWRPSLRWVTGGRGRVCWNVLLIRMEQFLTNTSRAPCVWPRMTPFERVRAAGTDLPAVRGPLPTSSSAPFYRHSTGRTVCGRMTLRSDDLRTAHTFCHLRFYSTHHCYHTTTGCPPPPPPPPPRWFYLLAIACRAASRTRYIGRLGTSARYRH